MPSSTTASSRCTRVPRFRPRSRAFYTLLLLVTAVASFALFAPRVRGYYYRDADDRRAAAAANNAFLNLVSARNAVDPTECGWVHNVEDQCGFVLARCADDQPSLVPYLRLYYCSAANARPVIFAVMVLWLGLLFTTIGIAASDFFSINLGTIATILHMPESMAGVTFLAFGNGSPDLFSTFAAMGSNSASMAVGELIGAAGFITAVVAGSMALVREFKVDRKTYVRDISFFMVAVALTCGFLIDGELHLWECLVMIGYYLVYVATVVGGHWVSSRRKARLAANAAAVKAGHPQGASSPTPAGPGQPEAAEPYRDVPDGEVSPRGGVDRSQTGLTDVSFLELGPRIEVSGDADQDELDSENSRLLAAELASHMRVLRPHGRRRSSIAPIRPSLVGALEFRSALAHASRDHASERTNSFPISPISPSETVPPRRYTDDPAAGESSPVGGLEAAPARQHAHTIDVVDGRRPAASPGQPSTSLAPEALPVDPQPSRRRSPSPTSAYTVGGSLAPPPTNSLGRLPVVGNNNMPVLRPTLPRLQLPDQGADGDDPSGGLTPFPQYIDSPLPISPLSERDFASLVPATAPLLPQADMPSGSFPQRPVDTDTQNGATEYRLWPYRFLPPPDIVLRALFPTVQDWRDKSMWDKFVSAISIPSVLLLVLTLPVVEAEKDVDGEDGNATIIDPPGLGTANGWAEALIANNRATAEPDGELDLFRRRLSRSHTGRSSLHSPALISLRSPSRSRAHSGAHSFVFPDGFDVNQPIKPWAAGGQSHDDDEGNDDEDEGEINRWNRWLVALQIFTGPQFAAFIFWANLAEDLSDPWQVYTWMALSMLAVSVVLCGLLLRTTNESQRPKYHSLLCFLGFLISIAWISTIASEVVGVLKAVGIIFDISEAILGLTVFAAGNSVGDLVADITVARLGYPVMALSACFGGPMLNILLGIGIGGFWMMFQDAKHHHAKHPGRPYRYKPYKISVGPTLMVSAIVLLLTLLILLVTVPWTKWVLTRKLGLVLIALWTIGTAANVALELTGAWTDFD